MTQEAAYWMLPATKSTVEYSLITDIDFRSTYQLKKQLDTNIAENDTVATKSRSIDVEAGSSTMEMESKKIYKQTEQILPHFLPIFRIASPHYYLFNQATLINLFPKLYKKATLCFSQSSLIQH